MLTNTATTQLAKLMANTDPAIPDHFAVGSGTTNPTRADTDLETQISNRIATTTTEESNVVKVSAVILTTDSAYFESITESGLFDAATSGNMYNRDTNLSVVPNSDSDTTFIKFIGINRKTNNSRNVITDVAVNALTTWFTGTPFTEPTHIAWGTLPIIDSCEAIGSAPNNWANSIAAITPTLNTTIYEEGENSINLGKSGTATTIAYYDRTLASGIDLGTATYLDVRLYIDDSATLASLKNTAGLKIWIGNDSSNYYTYSINADTLYVGWQNLHILISDMTETGTVTDSAIDYLRITFETNNATDTIALGKILMDFWAFYGTPVITDTALKAEIYINAMDTGYPTYTSSTVKYSAVMAKADGNTYIYNYSGLFNAASSGDLFIHQYYYDIVKNAYVQVTQNFDITFTLRDL